MSLTHPTRYCCPIGLELMRDPVIMENGKTYERKKILEYLEKHSYKLPITNKVLSPESISMKEDIDLKNEINEYLKKNKIIDVFVKDVDSTIFIITMKSDDTVEKLKEIILEMSGKAKNILLLYQNSNLWNDKLKLSDYKIEYGSMVHVIALLPG